MKLRKAIGIVATVIAAVGVGCVLHLVPKQREIVLAATGPEDVAVEGFAIVDGRFHVLSGELPQTWTFRTSKLEFQLHQTDPESTARIHLTTHADDEELGTVEQQSVHGGCRFTGIGPFGGSETSIGGTWTVE